MANPEHVEVVKQGADAINAWRDANPDERLDLESAGLSATDLEMADLRGADFRRANLSEADLSWADVSRANLDGVTTGWTVFVDVDLSAVASMADVTHNGPSSIGVDTLYRSHGKIPLVFLRGCGVPEPFIAQIPSLIDALVPIQFYSCFVSYGHTDEDFCQRLYSRMRDEGLQVWYAPDDMKSGLKPYEQIDGAIRVHNKLLLILSEHSMASEWVKNAVRHARQREAREGKRVLFPVRLVPSETIRDWTAFDADIGKDMAVGGDYRCVRDDGGDGKRSHPGDVFPGKLI